MLLEEKSSVPRTMVVAYVGQPDPLSPGYRTSTNEVKRIGTMVMGHPHPAWTVGNCNIAREYASPGYYACGAESQKFGGFIDDLLKDSLPGKVRAVAVNEQVPDGLRLLPADVSPPAARIDPTSGRLGWSSPNLSRPSSPSPIGSDRIPASPRPTPAI